MNFVPVAESTVLSFRIPFKQGKYDYKKDDIEPFIKSLNQPDFIINELTISAYSSIEGSEKINKVLQQKRAESIVKVLKQRQKTDIKTYIFTNDSWEHLY